MKVRARAAVAAFMLAMMLAPARISQLHGQQATLRRGDIVIRHEPAQQRLARTILPGSRYPAFPGLPSDILDRGTDVTVFLAPDAQRWDSLTGGRAPEWGAGVAMPQLGIIVVPGFVSSRGTLADLPETVRHELAHVALQRHLGNALVPRWFTEGYATWTAGQFDPQQGWQLRLALLLDRAPALDSVTLHWPLIEGEARLAYLLSASAVTYLNSLGPPENWDRFLTMWADSGDIEPAMRAVYRVSSPQFERLWIAHVKRRYGWLQVAAQGAFIWGVLGIAVIALFVVRRRRDRRRLAALHDNELPDEPAFWNEEDEDAPGTIDAEDAGPGDVAPERDDGDGTPRA